MGDPRPVAARTWHKATGSTWAGSTSPPWREATGSTWAGSTSPPWREATGSTWAGSTSPLDELRVAASRT